MDAERDLSTERDRLAAMRDRVEELIGRKTGDLGDARLGPHAGTAQARSEREARDREASRDLVRLRATRGRPLCFGRLDGVDGDITYVGRLSLSDDEREPLLSDWRTPVAEPFYKATPLHPMGIARRRHFVMRDADELVDAEDEVFGTDLAAAHEHGLPLRGEGALLTALSESRTAHMRDIVATIQRDQDEIIRLPLRHTVVVQGGPGTGKTVVALHRAAYLLYTHRAELERSGVLVVGPNVRFIDYVSRVLPSLGETGALLSPIGELYPGVKADLHDAPDVAAIKGDTRMIGVMRRCIRAHERVPRRTPEIGVGSMSIHLDRDTLTAARNAARASGRPHNDARAVFVAELRQAIAAIVEPKLVRRRGTVTANDIDDAVEVVMADRGVRKMIKQTWPKVTPHDVLRRLRTDERFRNVVTRNDLDAAEAALLIDDAAAPWSIEDVPLLDELAELIGTLPVSNEETRAARADRSQQRFERQTGEVLAKELLDSMAGSENTGDEADMLNLGALRPDDLGHLHEVVETDDFETMARRDRTWRFGHLIVDEAQELSPMAWRLLGRRCPSRSATIVGDLDQGRARRDSWDAALAGTRFETHTAMTLTINYRTPAEIMAIAAQVLATTNPHATPPEAVRASGEAPRFVSTSATDRWERLGALIEHDRATHPADSIAVIVAPEHQAAAQHALGDAAPVFTPIEVKGLEFDAAVIGEPAAIATGPTGAADLYVALTRPTKRLTVLHADPLPDGITPPGTP